MTDKHNNVFEIDGGNQSDSESDCGSENSDGSNYVMKQINGGGKDNNNDSDYDEDAVDSEDEEFASPDGEEYEEIERNKIIDDFSDNDEDDDDDDDENYLQKFDQTLKTNVITEHHPELIVHNFQEVDALCHVVRNADGIIIDPLHRTLPFITKYEKAKILGERAKQINSGATIFVDVNEEIIDGYLIALAEFEKKKIPMIIRRPLPNNGSEYWRLEDLEIL